MARHFSGGAASLGAGAPITAPPITLVCWYRPTAATPFQNLVVLDDVGTSHFYSLRTASAAPAAGALDGTGYAQSLHPTLTTLHTWSHLAAVYASPSSRTVYLDGVAGPVNTTAITPSVSHLNLGAILDGSQYWAEGDLAEVGIWSAALTADEIAALAKGVSPIQIRPAALVAYIPIGGDVSPEPDRWRGRHDVTLFGTAPKAAGPRVYHAGALLVPPVKVLSAALAGVGGVTLAATANLTTPIRLAAAAGLAIATVASFASAPLLAEPSLTIGTTATLTAPVPLRAGAGLRFGTFVAFGRPMTATAGVTFGARATISPSPRESAATITIDGVDVRGRVRMKGVTIRDILNDAPNTCSLVIDGAAPAVGQRLRITVNEGARVLFAGTVQSVAESFELQPKHLAWAVTAIDDTAAANQKRPFGTWVNTSATTIAQFLTTHYAPAFSPAGIAADLPPVSMVFDGSDTLIAALARLASAIGGYTKIEDATIYLFIVDTGAAPDPIDAAHPFLLNPAIAMTVDASQLRTRVYGKGYGEPILADLAPGETLIPLANGATFSRYGGRAIAATTADGAQSEQLTFTGREVASGGTLVGSGAAPTTAPAVALAPGAGVDSGDHEYAIAFVTAAGRSMPGPRARITVGLLPAPATALVAGAPYAGPGNLMTPGSHRYYAVFRTATGTTTPGPVSNSVSALAPTAAPGTHVASGDYGDGGLGRGLFYFYKSTFYRPADGTETEPNVHAALYTYESNWDTGWRTGGVQQLAPPAGFVQRVYRTIDGTTASTPQGPFARIVNLRDSGGAYWMQADSALGAAPPTANTTGKGSSTLTNIPVSPSPAVTQVDIYREFNNAGAATARLVTSVANGTTSLVDGLGNASLGALLPSTNTAAANRVTVTWPAAPTGVTAIEIYRTQANLSPLYRANTAAGNAGGSFVDSTADAFLGALAATDDTSGLTQPAGQVNPGAVVLPVASSTPFGAGGGWVILGGGQVVRYTGISGQSLIGVPAAGAGAITTTVLYGSQAIPASMLTGVSGITVPIAKGSAIHIWVQVDDLQAQAAQAARAGGDGVIEYVLVDTRRGAESLTARCQADLALFARPIVTVTYATRDLKTQSGKTVVIDLPSPSIHEALIIQDVTISAIDIVPNLSPRFTVQASSVRFSLEDTLRRLIAGGLIVGGSS